MAQLDTTRGPVYSVVSIGGNPPFGLTDRQYKALGQLAQAAKAKRVFPLPPDAPSGPCPGWGITARTTEFEPIAAAAAGILSDRYEALTKYQSESE